MDRNVAVAINENVEFVVKKIFETGDILRLRMSGENFKVYSDMVGEIMLRLDPGVLEWVYRFHPDLRPVDLSPLRPFGPDG